MVNFSRWKVIFVFVVALFGVAFALPNVFPTSVISKLPTWLPHKHMNLGLDLRGGAHLLLGLGLKVE